MQITRLHREIQMKGSGKWKESEVNLESSISGNRKGHLVTKNMYRTFW